MEYQRVKTEVGNELEREDIVKIANDYGIPSTDHRHDGVKLLNSLEKKGVFKQNSMQGLVNVLEGVGNGRDIAKRLVFPFVQSMSMDSISNDFNAERRMYESQLKGKDRASIPNANPNSGDKLDEEALRKVKLMLSEAKGLTKLDSIKVGVKRRKEENESKLRTVMDSFLKKAESSIEELEGAERALAEVNEDIIKLNVLCEKNTELTDGFLLNNRGEQSEMRNFGFIEALFVANRNVVDTLEEVKNIRQISEEVDELNRILDENPGNMLEVHKRLGKQIEKRELCKSKVEEHEDLLDILKEDLECVTRLEDRIVNMACIILEDALHVSQERPEILVKAVRIMHRDELKAKRRKRRDIGHFQKFKDALAMSAKNIFDAKMSTLTLPEAVGVAMDHVVDVLLLIYDDVVPCFPERYDVKRMYCENLHKLLLDAINELPEKCREKDFDLDSTMKLVDNASEYHAQLWQHVGIYEPEPNLVDALGPVLQLATLNTIKRINEYMENLLSSQEHKKFSKDDGMLHSNLPFMLFTVILNPLEKIQRSGVKGKETLLYRLAMTSIDSLRNFAQKWKEIVSSNGDIIDVGSGGVAGASGSGGGHGDGETEDEEKLKREREELAEKQNISIINDCNQCYVYIGQVVSFLSSNLEEERVSDLDVNPVGEEFQQVEQRSVIILAKAVLEEVLGYFEGELFHIKNWKEGGATFREFLGELSVSHRSLEGHIPPESLAEVSGHICSGLVGHYVRSVSSLKGTLKGEGVDRIVADKAAMDETFSGMAVPDLGEKLRPMKSLHGCLTAEEFILPYVQELSKSVGLSAQEFKTLIGLRPDKSNIAEKVVESCMQFLNENTEQKRRSKR